MRTYRSVWLVGAVLVLAIGVSGSAAAADDPDPVGTWKWSFTTQNGQTIETTLKIKKDGDKLSGAISGRNGQETAVDELKVEKADISFQVTRERNGQKFTTKYKGKIDGDVIKGKFESGSGDQTRSRDWEAKREKAKS